MYTKADTVPETLCMENSRWKIFSISHHYVRFVLQ